MDSTIIEATYRYSYTDEDGSVVSFAEGERFILLNKSSSDWWKVQRTGVFSGKSVCYVPASYMKEVNITPRGKTGFVNQYVNMEVYKKIMKRDTEGLAKLGNRSMVTSKPAAIITPSESEKSSPELNVGNHQKTNSTDQDEIEDKENFKSLEDIPADIRSLSIDTSMTSPDTTPTSPLSFELSPISDRMQSFTLPPGWKSKPLASPRKSWGQSDSLERAMDHYDKEMEKTPKGWSVEFDPDTDEKIYVNRSTKEKWKASVDSKNQTYYYNIDGSSGTTWKLPEIESPGRPQHLRNKSLDDALKGVIRRQTISGQTANKNKRNSKCNSVVMQSPGSTEDLNDHKTSSSTSITSATESVLDGSSKSIDVIESKSGALLRRKVSEGRKSIKKPVWTNVFCCKIGSNLVFYKDQKSASPKNGYPTGKPESSLDLHGATLDHISKEKVKGKKFVFQISSYGGQNIQQFVADNQIEMGEWIVSIQHTIQKLEEDDPLPPHPLVTVDEVDNTTTPKSPNSLSPPQRLSPTQTSKPASPGAPKKLQSGESKGFKSFSRRLSKRVGGGGNNEDDKEKTKIRDRLKKYLSKRPSFTELETKGIISDFVFGYPLLKLCEREDTLVPKFIVSIILEVERRGLHVDGIYRVSGNLSTINKLRGLIDNGENVNYSLPEWSDIHLLTGCLKLYFRELPDPLIPCKFFDRFVNTMKSPFKEEKIKLLKKLLSEIPQEHFETLNQLMIHFRRVLQHTSENRMQSQNLSIVFGPTLLWPEKENLNMTMATVYQNQLIEFLISESEILFPS